jgi:hypothetical protein
MTTLQRAFFQNFQPATAFYSRAGDKHKPFGLVYKTKPFRRTALYFTTFFHFNEFQKKSETKFFAKFSKTCAIGFIFLVFILKT